MSARDDDLRAVDQVLARRQSPELSTAFAGAVRKLFEELGWWTGLAEAGDLECVPPEYTDVSATFLAGNGGYIDLRIGATTERHIDIVHLLSRLVALAANGCGRLPPESIEVRRLLARAIAAAEGLPADDATLDVFAALPGFSGAFEALQTLIEDAKRETAE